MNKTRSVRSHRIGLAACAAAASLCIAGVAHADNHALIMWVGDYPAPNTLKGIDIDAANARVIAHAMGIADQKIVEISNAQVTMTGISNALDSMARDIAPDDKVFIYYSGHGGQRDGRDNGVKCTEGMVTRDLELFEDFRLNAALVKLGQKASQVVMMNDSCFSGGAATKDAAKAGDGRVAKAVLTGNLKSGSAADPDYRCGEPVNKMARNLEAIGKAPRGPQVLYIAAAADNEVAYATPNGSIATLAWRACLASDANHSGSVSGDELRSCAQGFVGEHRFNQTITLAGNTSLPLSFVAQGGGAGAVNPLATLRDIAAARDRSQNVVLTAAKSSMRIGQDPLDFAVKTDHAGYLYLLQLGSDGHTLNVLFPNKNDTNNYLGVGVHVFPRPTWQVRSAGPAGTSYLLAVLSSTKKDLSKGMDMSDVFATAPASPDVLKNLVVEGTGASDGSGRYGASEIVGIREVN